MNIMTVEERLEALEKEIQRLKDVQAIKELKSKYFCLIAKTLFHDQLIQTISHIAQFGIIYFNLFCHIFYAPFLYRICVFAYLYTACILQGISGILLKFHHNPFISSVIFKRNIIHCIKQWLISISIRNPSISGILCGVKSRYGVSFY